MEKTTLKVQGMSCGSCVNSIERSVGNLNGINSVKVHLNNDTVDVEYDPSTVSLEEIKNKIEDQGYNVAS